MIFKSITNILPPRRRAGSGRIRIANAFIKARHSRVPDAACRRHGGGFGTVILLISLFFVSSAQAALNVGDKAPALVVTDLAGVKVDLNDMKRKTVIVALWASWCEPCRTEIPMLRDFYHKYEDQGIEIVALSLDKPHDRKAVEKIAAKVDYHIAMASDASANGFDDTTSLPVTYVIGDGKVKAVFDQGAVTGEELAKAALP